MAHFSSDHFSGTVRATKDVLKHGPLDVRRLNTLPTNTFGRNGDLVIVDNTAEESPRVAENRIPTTVSLCQKVPFPVTPGTFTITTASGVFTITIVTIDDVVEQIRLANIPSLTIEFGPRGGILVHSVPATWADGTSNLPSITGIAGAQVGNYPLITGEWKCFPVGSFGAQSYGSITGGDGGTTVAVLASEIITFSGTGVNIVGVDSGVPGSDSIAFSLDVNDLPAAGKDIVASDLFAIYDGTTNLKYTGQEVADGLLAILGIAADSYSNITGGDGGTAVSIGNDTITFNGEGINIVATNAGAGLDTVAFDLDISDLGAGVTVALANEFAVDQGADPNVKFTFTDMVEDLDIPNAITVNGLVTRTAADTYTSRSIAASIDEDELGIAVTNGDGVSGNPTIGLDILGLVNEGDIMAATDEFPLHDKSEDTEGGNRKITGQNIADGVIALVGGGLSFASITGADTVASETMAFVTDATRTKDLSITESMMTFGADKFDVGDLLLPHDHQQTDLDSGYIMPYDGTIVRATVRVADPASLAKEFGLGIDGSFTATVLSTAATAPPADDFATDVDIDFAAGDHLQAECDGGGAGESRRVVLNIWVKWRNP